MKETAKCTCSSCGKSFDKILCEVGKGAGKRLQEKVKWAENGGITLCTDCWKEKRREEEKAKGLTCDIRVSSVMDQELRYWAVFGGDSYSHKEELKAAGARYTQEYPCKEILPEVLGITEPKPAWCLYDTDFDALIEKATTLGAAVSYPSGETLSLWAAMRREVEAAWAKRAKERVEAQKKREEQKQRELDALGPIPSWPESIAAK